MPFRPSGSSSAAGAAAGGGDSLETMAEEAARKAKEEAGEEARRMAHLVETLTAQCNNLAWRLVALEKEVEESRR